MEEDGHGKRVSSRLSAKAQPFTLNRFPAQPTWSSVDPCDDSLITSLSNFNLEGDPLCSASQSCHDLSNFGLNSYFREYPSANSVSDFSLEVSNDSLQSCTKSSSFGHPKAGLSCAKYASSVYETSLDQGSPAVKKSKLSDKGAESSCEKCSDLTIERNPLYSKSTGQVDAGKMPSSAVNCVATTYESPRSVMCSASMLESYFQTHVPYTAASASLSNSSVPICESGRLCVPCPAKSKVSHSHKDNVVRDMAFNSSDTGTFSPSNAEFAVSFGVNYNDCSFKSSPPGIMDIHHLLDGENKEIQCDGSPSDKGNESKGGKLVSSEGLKPLLMHKSKPQVAFGKLHNDFDLESLDGKATVSFSTKLDENDSDVDSPCWKGTQASRQSPFGVSKSVSTNFVESSQEASYSLNPLAPLFIPRPTKASVNYHAKKYTADDFSTFRKSESAGVGEFSEGKISVDKEGSESSLSINGIGTQTCNDICEPKREYALLINRESDSVLNLPEGQSKLLSAHAQIDVPSLLNLMHHLSELLVKNCSVNKHKPELIQHIISNLCECIQHTTAGKTQMPGLMLIGTPYYPKKSTDLIKCSNMRFQVEEAGALAAPHELDDQNGRVKSKISCHDFTKRVLDSSPSCSSVDTEKGNNILQVMGTAYNHSSNEEIDPQALVYKKLWLEAEAALCAMKYENAVMREIRYGNAQFTHR